MYYLAHLALPAIVALIMAVSGAQIELSLSWFARTTEKLAEFYMIFATPYWIWAAISGYFEASKGATVGGFVGLHLLLFSVWFLVAQSDESHAANGWCSTSTTLTGRRQLSWPVDEGILGSVTQ